MTRRNLFSGLAAATVAAPITHADVGYGGSGIGYSAIYHTIRLLQSLLKNLGERLTPKPPEPEEIPGGEPRSSQVSEHESGEKV